MDRGTSYELPPVEEEEKKGGRSISNDTDSSSPVADNAYAQSLNPSFIRAQESESFQDAVAVSSALVGEVVVDSPDPGCKPALDEEYFHNASMHLASPDLSSLQLTLPQHGQLRDNTNEIAVGIMGWVRRQRDSRKRLDLQTQAEQQLEKLRLAQGFDDRRSGNTFHDTISYDSATIDSNHGSVEAVVSKSGDGISVSLASISESNGSARDESFVPPVRVDESLENKKDPTPFILSTQQMHEIATAVLPRSISYSRWKRLYSLARDGDSFDACLRAVTKDKQTLLVVRTTLGEVFGGFADSTWEPHY